MKEIKAVIAAERDKLLERIAGLVQEVRELDDLVPIMEELDEYQAVYYKDSYSEERLHRVSDSIDDHTIAFELETLDEYEDGSMTTAMTSIEAAKWFKDCLAQLEGEDVSIECQRKSGLIRRNKV